MEPEFAANEILKVIRGELDDCQRAIKHGNVPKALNELEDAIRKLREIAAELR